MKYAIKKGQIQVVKFFLEHEVPFDDDVLDFIENSDPHSQEICKLLGAALEKQRSPLISRDNKM